MQITPNDRKLFAISYVNSW